MTKEMIQLLKQLTDLADEASVTIYDDGKENGTSEIIMLCKKLAIKIDEYLENRLRGNRYE